MSDTETLDPPTTALAIIPASAPTISEFFTAWANELRTLTIPAIEMHAQWAREAEADMRAGMGLGERKP